MAEQESEFPLILRPWEDEIRAACEVECRKRVEPLFKKAIAASVIGSVVGTLLIQKIFTRTKDPWE